MTYTTEEDIPNRRRRHVAKYGEIKEWVKGLQIFTLVLIEREFSLRYKEAKKILPKLQEDGVVALAGNSKGEYSVLKRLWGDDE